MAGVQVECEQIRDTGRKRLLVLSQPKEPNVEWWTNIGPHVMWGTQEMMWPISGGAMGAESTSRLKSLARPKRNFQNADDSNTPLFLYSCGRDSALFETSPDARTAQPSARLTALAQAKQFHKEYRDDKFQYLYSCGRSSPIEDTNWAATRCPDRDLTLKLSQPKSPVREFQGNRQVATVITDAALKARPSERLETLSAPKHRSLGPFRDPEWPITRNAKNAAATPRCAELARPKSLSEGYLPAKEVEWPISRAAKRTSATTRLNQLSQPIVRASMDHVQFNPDAFIVKPTALTARTPARIEELAHPIQRG